MHHRLEQSCVPSTVPMLMLQLDAYLCASILGGVYVPSAQKFFYYMGTSDVLSKLCFVCYTGFQPSMILLVRCIWACTAVYAVASIWCRYPMVR